jgi:hypothetical protein
VRVSGGGVRMRLAFGDWRLVFGEGGKMETRGGWRVSVEIVDLTIHLLYV